MLDHIFLTVGDLRRSVEFYERVLAPLGVQSRLDYDGKDGPPGHPDRICGGHECGVRRTLSLAHQISSASLGRNRRPISSSMASNGAMRAVAVSSKTPSSTHAPSRRARASTARSSGSINQ